jgi:broad specificity phosphatase PhoE
VEIFLIRHGDKLSKYPPCDSYTVKATEPCFNKTRFGNNPELSECGRRQARLVSERLLAMSPSFASVFSSPFMRTLQTAAPLAVAANTVIKVEALFSEDRQLNGPDQPRQSEASHSGASDWTQIEQLWDRGYSSPPIPTPEGNVEFWRRMVLATSELQKHARLLPNAPSSIAVFTHAGPSFSLAFGLCANLFGGSLEEFIRSKVAGAVDELEGMAPTGIMRVVLDRSSGTCITLDTPDNTVWHDSGCGRTKPHKKMYAADPGKYWRPPSGVASGGIDRSGD